MKSWTRAVAATVVVSLLTTAPGPEAWAAAGRIVHVELPVSGGVAPSLGAQLPNVSLPTVALPAATLPNVALPAIPLPQAPAVPQGLQPQSQSPEAQSAREGERFDGTVKRAAGPQDPSGEVPGSFSIPSDLKMSAADNASVSSFMAGFHDGLVASHAKYEFTVRDYYAWARYVRFYTPSLGVKEAVRKGALYVYGDRLEDHPELDAFKAKLNSEVRSLAVSDPKHGLDKAKADELFRLAEPEAQEVAADEDSPYDLPVASLIPDKERSALVATPTTLSRIEAAASAFALRDYSLLLGPPATEKSAIPKYLASEYRIPYLAVTMHPGIGTFELVGGYRPKVVQIASLDAARKIVRTKLLQAEQSGQFSDLAEAAALVYGAKPLSDVVGAIKDDLTGEQSKELVRRMLTLAHALEYGAHSLVWQDGYLTYALKRDIWITFEELNAAPTESQEFLNKFMQSRVLEVTQKLGETEVLAPKKGGRFMLWATMNPETDSNREVLSKTLKSRWRVKYFGHLPAIEQAEIIEKKFGIPNTWALSLVENFHVELNRQARGRVIGGLWRDGYEINLRHLLKAARRWKRFVEQEQAGGKTIPESRKRFLLGREVFSVYGGMMRTANERQGVFTMLDQALRLSSVGARSIDDLLVKPAGFEDLGDRIRIGDVTLEKGKGGPFVPKPNPDYLLDAAGYQRLYEYAKALAMGEPLLLMGESAAGKTSDLEHLFYRLNRNLRYKNLDSDTAIEEVIGGFAPGARRGAFSFQEGMIPKAMEERSGAFLDEFNLNPLVEWLNTVIDDGRLYLPQRIVEGQPLIVAAANPPEPRYPGRILLSAATRSRYTERWVDADASQDRLKRLMEHWLRGGTAYALMLMTGLGTALHSLSGGAPFASAFGSFQKKEFPWIMLTVGATAYFFIAAAAHFGNPIGFFGAIIAAWAGIIMGDKAKAWNRDMPLTPADASAVERHYPGDARLWARHHSVRLTAIRILGTPVVGTRGALALEVLAKAETTPENVNAAIEALGKIGTVEAGEALSRLAPLLPAFSAQIAAARAAAALPGPQEIAIPSIADAAASGLASRAEALLSEARAKSAELGARADLSSRLRSAALAEKARELEGALAQKDEDAAAVSFRRLEELLKDPAGTAPSASAFSWPASVDREMAPYVGLALLLISAIIPLHLIWPGATASVIAQLVLVMAGFATVFVAPSFKQPGSVRRFFKDPQNRWMWPYLGGAAAIGAVEILANTAALPHIFIPAGLAAIVLWAIAVPALLLTHYNPKPGMRDRAMERAFRRLAPEARERLIGAAGKRWLAYESSPDVRARAYADLGRLEGDEAAAAVLTAAAASELDPSAAEKALAAIRIPHAVDALAAPSAPQAPSALLARAASALEQLRGEDLVTRLRREALDEKARALSSALEAGDADAIAVASRRLEEQLKASASVDAPASAFGALRRWLGGLKKKPSDPAAADDAPARPPTLEELARAHGVPDADLPKLRAKIERVQTTIRMVGSSVGRDGRTKWEPGDLWAYFPDENKATYPFEHLLTHSEEELVGLTDHEGLHRDATRLDPRFALVRKYQEDPIKHLLWNGVEDPRINNWGLKRLPGSDKYLHAAYDRYLPKNLEKAAPKSAGDVTEMTGDGASAFNPEAMKYPHIEYIMAANYYWRHGEKPPRFVNASAEKAFDASKEDLDKIFHDYPRHTDASEQEKLAYSMDALKRVDEKLLPLYEPLVQESQRKLAKNKSGKGKGKGQGQGGAPPTMPPPKDHKPQDGKGKADPNGKKKPGDKPGDEKAAGGDKDETIDPKDLQKALDELREQAKKAAEELAGKIKDNPTNKDAADARKKAAGDDKKSEEKDDAKPLTLQDIARTQREQRMNRQADAYERAFAPVAHLSNAMVTRLENVFQKNARPKDVGYFRNGKRPDVKRYMKRQGEGGVRDDYMLRRQQKTKRRYKVSLLVDASASMANYGHEAIRAVILLVDSLARLGIDTEVILFSDVARVVKEFDAPLTPESKDALATELTTYMANLGSGATHDGEALTLALGRLEKQDADRKFVFVVTDGAGNGKVSVASVLPKAAAAEAEVVGVGVGAGMAYVKTTYPRNAAVDKIEDLPETLKARLEDYISGQEQGAPRPAQSFVPGGDAPASAFRAPRALAWLFTPFWGKAYMLALAWLSFITFLMILCGPFAAYGPAFLVAGGMVLLKMKYGGRYPETGPLGMATFMTAQLAGIGGALAPLGVSPLVAFFFPVLMALWFVAEAGGMLSSRFAPLGPSLLAALREAKPRKSPIADGLMGLRPARLKALARLRGAPEAAAFEPMTALLERNDPDQAVRDAARKVRLDLEQERKREAEASAGLAEILEGAGAPHAPLARRAKDWADAVAADAPLAQRLKREAVREALAALASAKDEPNAALAARRLAELMGAAGGDAPASAFGGEAKLRLISMATVSAFTFALVGGMMLVGFPFYVFVAAAFFAPLLFAAVKLRSRFPFYWAAQAAITFVIFFLGAGMHQTVWSWLIAPFATILGLKFLHPAWGERLLPLSDLLAARVKAALPAPEPDLLGFKDARFRALQKIASRPLAPYAPALKLLAHEDPDPRASALASSLLQEHVRAQEEAAAQAVAEDVALPKTPEAAETVSARARAELARLESEPALASRLRRAALTEALAAAEAAPEDGLALRRLEELLAGRSGSDGAASAFGYRTANLASRLERFMPASLALWLALMSNLVIVIAACLGVTALFPGIQQLAGLLLPATILSFFLMKGEKGRFWLITCAFSFTEMMVLSGQKQPELKWMGVACVAALGAMVAMQVVPKWSVQMGRLPPMAYDLVRWALPKGAGARARRWTRGLAGFETSRRRAIREMLADPKAAREVIGPLSKFFSHAGDKVTGDLVELMEKLELDEADEVLRMHALFGGAQKQAAAAALARREEMKKEPLQELLVLPKPDEEAALRAAAARVLAQPARSLPERLKRGALEESLKGLDAAGADEKPSALRRLRELLAAATGTDTGASAWSPILTSAAAALAAAIPALLLAWSLSPLAAAALGAGALAASGRAVLKPLDFRSAQVHPGPSAESDALPEWIPAQRAFSALLGKLDAPSAPRLALAVEPDGSASGNAHAGGTKLDDSSYVALGERWLAQPRAALEGALAHELGHLSTGELALRAYWSRLQRVATLAVLVSAVLAPAAGAAGAALLIVSWLLRQAVSRRNELRADSFAARLAGLPAARAFLDSVEKFSLDGQPGGRLELFLSHPSLARRRANLER